MKLKFPLTSPIIYLRVSKHEIWYLVSHGNMGKKSFSTLKKNYYFIFES